MSYYFTIAFLVLPLLFLILIAYWWDKKEPEPLSLLAKLFVAGIFVAVGIITLLGAIQVFLVSTGLVPVFDSISDTDGLFTLLAVSIIIASVHEILKYVVGKKMSEKTAYFTQAVDGAVYLSAIAFGAAFMESVYWIISFYLGGVEMDVFHYAFRIIFPSLLMGATAGISGLALGFNRLNEVLYKGTTLNTSSFSASQSIVFALTQSIIIHTLFRFLVFTGELRLAGTVAIIASFYLFSRFASQTLTKKFAAPKSV